MDVEGNELFSNKWIGKIITCFASKRDWKNARYDNKVFSNLQKVLIL